jgi:hypothetical protein
MTSLSTNWRTISVMAFCSSVLSIAAIAMGWERYCAGIPLRGGC